MFTGLVQEIGTIHKIQKSGGGMKLTVLAPDSTSHLSVNDSVAINGCCLTVVSKLKSEFTIEAVEETLTKTNLGTLSSGSSVNLELAMQLNDRLGGHLVLGHVDATGEIVSIKPMENSWLYSVRVPPDFLHYIIPVGSIAIDGVSLTVARIQNDQIMVSIISHTFEHTTFKFLRTGSRVNLEFDII
ncbi:MAG: riboflavin synthase, partial [bacterium]